MIGAQNLSKLNISAAIEKARTTHAVRAELNADMVIDELRKIAFANLADYVSRTAAGEPYLDFSVLTRVCRWGCLPSARGDLGVQEKR